MGAYLQAGIEALGDATRLAIFRSLAAGPMAVNELAETFPVSRPAVSQHLRVLKEAGLVTDRKEGTRRLYQLNPQGIALLRAHFDQLWDQALTAFQTAAEKPPATKKEATKKEKEKSRARTRKRSSRT